MRAAAPLAALLLLAAPAPAQQRGEAAPPRFYGGIGVDYAHPAGEFGDSIDDGFGIGVNLLYRVDPRGILGIRLDGGAAVYGVEERRVLLSPTIGGRITVDLNTTNSIAYLTAGPQLMLPTGRIRPYLNAVAGLGYFSTTSSLRGDHGEAFANTTNQDDLALAYGGGAGLYVPLRRGRTPVSLDLGVRYRHTPEVSYLREGSIRDLPGGEIGFDPITTETDLFQFQVGVEVGLRRSEDRWGRRCRRC